MDNAFASAEGVLCLCVSLALLYIVMKVWRAIWIDQARGQLFELRDSLFLYSVDNGLIEHSANIKLRQYNNALLRYTHKISFLELTAIALADKLWVGDREKKTYSELQLEIDKLPSRHKKFFEQHHANLNVVMTKYLFKSSFILRISFLCAIPFILLSGEKREKRLDARTSAILEREAFAA